MPSSLAKNENGFTELQQRFLDAYFGEAQGNAAEAMKIAGYKHSHVPYVLDSLKDEIAKRTEGFLALHSFPAAKSLIGIMDDPTQEGAKIKLEATKDILDRVGLSKKGDGGSGKETKIGIFILPAKSEVTTMPVIEHN